MDEKRAAAIMEEIRGCSGLGFDPEGVLGFGKSAAVYKARDDKGATLALKVYDPEILQRYGHDVQKGRLERELSLKGHTCSNLVTILGGGDVSLTAGPTFFLAMEYVEGEDLRTHIKEAGRLPDADIRRFLGQLFSAADYLLERNLCHRDIKVDNIRIAKDGRLVLLDLGVLRPIAQSDLTDHADDPKQRYFLGTLRYSPPEYLVREEDDSVGGWKAVTIYQIGTVLYEMLVGAKLFSHIEHPYPDLVRAVLHYRPPIHRSDVGQDLVKLTRRSLLKEPGDRLKAVQWEAISSTAKAQPPSSMPRPSEIDALLEEAARQYEEKVRHPAEANRKANEKAGQDLKEAVALTKKELLLERIGASKPTVDVYDGRSYLMVVSHYGPSLPHRITEDLRLAVYFPLQQDPVGLLQVSGMGLYGSMMGKGVRETNNIISENNLNKTFELIWEGYYEDQDYEPALVAWIDRMLAAYFKYTEARYNEVLEREQQMAEARRGNLGGAVWSETRVAETYGFNTKERKKINPSLGRR